MDANQFATISELDSLPTKSPEQGHRVPTSSFTFSLSDLWKPTKEPIKQWIQNLPVHVRREDTLEPARYRNLKHSLVSIKRASTRSYFTFAFARWKLTLSSRVLKTPTKTQAPRITVTSERGLTQQQGIEQRRSRVAAGSSIPAEAWSAGFLLLTSVL